MKQIQLDKLSGAVSPMLLGACMEDVNHELYGGIWSQMIFGEALEKPDSLYRGANAIVDAVSATVMKQHNPGLTDPQLRQLIAAHIDDDSFCRYVIQQDINKIAPDLREAHKNDFFSVTEGQSTGRFLADCRRNRHHGQRPGTGGDGLYLQAAQAELWEIIRRGKEMAEKNCGEIGLAEKTKSTAREKVKERQNIN